jgi:putative acetyltransferase
LRRRLPVTEALAVKGITTVQIRQYRESDLEAVLSSWEKATRLAHPFMTNDFIVQERINVAEIYLPNTDTWVVEIGNNVEGFIALMGNEVGAIFLQPSFHGKGAGKALMDKAQELHGDLEVEVFQENTIGRKFYSQYGFEQLEEKIHEPTGQQVLRLKFTANKLSKWDAVTGAPA